MAEPATIGELLDRAARSTKGVRFLDRDERVRFLLYAELRARARATAAGLRARGVAPGDRVALILPTGPEFYDAFFGAVLAGAVPVPLYPPVRLARLDEYRSQTAELLRGCRARLVLGDERTARAIGRTVEDAAPALGFALVEDVRDTGHGTRPEAPPPVAPTDVALLQHSSGTTGTPRPVRLSHAAVLANVEAIRGRILAAYPEPETEHATVSWLPLYHDMGLIGCVLTSLAHPVDLTLLPPELFVARPAAWLRAISRYHATVSGAPNFAYAYCADRIDDDELEGVDLSSLRVALSGAEPVIPATLRSFARRFAALGLRPAALTPVYGLAEASLAVTFSDPAAPWRSRVFDRDTLLGDGVARSFEGPSGLELVSVGRPLDDVRLRIAGARAEGELGRVEVAGASLFDGYDDDPASTGAGWFDTGDTGFLFDGELFLYGRAKDVIILRGRKYAPAQVEEALAGTPGLRAGCAAAIGAPAGGSEEEGLVVLAERARGARSRDDEAVAEVVRRRVADRTGLVPAAVEILDPGALPRTSSGKIRRAEARRRYLDGGLHAPDGPGLMGLAAEVVRSRLALARVSRGAAPRPEAGTEAG